jgi:hypothetical protein
MIMTVKRQIHIINPDGGHRQYIIVKKKIIKNNFIYARVLLATQKYDRDR